MPYTTTPKTSEPSRAYDDRDMHPSEIRFHLTAIAKLALELADLVAPEPIIGADLSPYDFYSFDRSMTPERFERAERARDALQVHFASVIAGVGADQIL